MSDVDRIAEVLHRATCTEPWDACCWSMEDPDLSDCHDESGLWRPTGLESSLAPLLAAARAEAWNEGWVAAKEVHDLDGVKVWAHTVLPDGMEPNPYHIAREASTEDATTPEAATVEDVGRTIWDTSRADEGTISATGANIVARALLAAFTITRKAEQ